MRRTKAIILGANGQDASYLAEYLLELGYEVHGTTRRSSVSEAQNSRIAHLGDKVTLHYADLLDRPSLNKIFKEVQPDEIYHLAAQSHVRISFEVPEFTLMTNGIGTLNVLEAYRVNCSTAKMYFASSSEQFGISVDEDGYQRETTPMTPTSPYGCAKVLGYNLVRHYRRAYNLHVCAGILFNHESPRRATNFVTQKVVRGACAIKIGLQDKLELGNMDAYRDWCHSYDYVRAMHLILNHNEPQEFVVATGETNSVRDMCNFVFSYLGLSYGDYVVQNPKFLRKEELPFLRGDSTKIRTTLGWKPIYSFEMLMKEMVDFEMARLKK